MGPGAARSCFGVAGALCEGHPRIAGAAFWLWRGLSSV